MSIKLIAVDMDGTFLSDQKTYNRERFMAQYQQMKAQGIRFSPLRSLPFPQSVPCPCSQAGGSKGMCA